MRAILVSLFIIFGATTAMAAHIGNFDISVKRDPFEDGKSQAIAITGDTSQGFLLRCIQGSIDMALIIKIEKQHKYSIKYKIDEDGIRERPAAVIADDLIQILYVSTILEELNNAKSIAFRVEDNTSGVTSDYAFDLVAINAVTAVIKGACGNH